MCVAGLILGSVIRAARQGAAASSVGSLPGEERDFAGSTGEESTGAYEGGLAHEANAGPEI
jgi:hypothetical protein